MLERVGLPIGALILFGVWGFFSKLATDNIEPKSALVYYALGIAVVGIFALGLVGWKPETDSKGVIFAFVGGASAAFGGLLFLITLSTGTASRAVAITALYPVVTTVLTIIVLHETVSLKEAAAVMMAIVALVLYST